VKFSKLIVITIILTVVAFVAAVFYFPWHGRVVPDSLIYTFGTFVSAEVWALAYKSKGE
jgi:hypothetical protein